MITDADTLRQISNTFPNDAFEGDFRSAKLRSIADNIEKLYAAKQDHCLRCGQRPPHETLNCPPLTVWDCLDAEKKFYRSAIVEIDRKRQEIEELQAKVERLEEALAALGRKETTT